jgi:SAM-dependent methyltransferase
MNEDESLPTRKELDAVFLLKHGSPETTGWAPQRRYRNGYFTPADVYETLVARFVQPGIRWLDVGGGHAVFPDNPRLARQLVDRAAHVAAVDPSDNVHQNEFVQERFQGFLEGFTSAEPFDLATMRMVVEHVVAPESFVGALSRLVKPGGHAIVYTVNRWAPITLLSWAVPFNLHHTAKRLFWASEEKDTFPVQYRMNTRRTLKRLFHGAGFEERLFAKLDDVTTLGGFRRLNRLELLLWKGFRGVGLAYPENCLLGVYRRLP